MLIYNTTSTNPYYNLATEDYILKTYTTGDILLLWQNDNTIVVGVNQNTAEEINEPYAREHGINIVRRRTGGGAVYHDLGNLNFSFITNLENAEQLTIERFTLPIVKALQELGLEAECSGRNDIMVSGKKVSGNAQSVLKNRILHHGTLLFNSNIGVVASALKVKPEKFFSKSTKSVRSRVGNIAEFLPEGFSMEQFKKHIIQSLSAGQGNRELLLTPGDVAEIQQLQKNQYETWDWNFGKSPHFNFKNMKKYPGGIVEINLLVQEGYIKKCAIFGDFMALKSTEQLAGKLENIRYAKADIKAALHGVALAEYLGAVTLEDLTDCMLNPN